MIVVLQVTLNVDPPAGPPPVSAVDVANSARDAIEHAILHSQAEGHVHPLAAETSIILDRVDVRGVYRSPAGVPSWVDLAPEA